MQKNLESHETLLNTSKYEYKHMQKNGEGISFCASKSCAYCTVVREKSEMAQPCSTPAWDQANAQSLLIISWYLGSIFGRAKC